MREAQQKIRDREKDDSLQDMREAEQKLQEAKQDLERILRQLREEEIKRTLASLESRFRKMLEVEIKIYDDTVALDRSTLGDNTPDLAIQCGKLSVRQKRLVTEAARALLLLEDDGTSIAIAESVRQLQLDMQQVSERLSALTTGEITQEIQQSVIETLGYLVEVFKQAREDAEQKSNPNQPSQPNRPGEQALVNQIAELKLIRGLQQQILRRHSRYASLLPDPDDPIGQTADPVIRSALDKLSFRQQTLQQITHDIVIGKNQ